MLFTFFILHYTFTAHLHNLLKEISSISSLKRMLRIFLRMYSENFLLITRKLREN